MATSPVFDRQIVLNRLRHSSQDPCLQEEEAHPWRVRLYQPFHVPLLRLWDCRSGSKPEKDTSMRSRAPEMRLDDRESRQASLSIHINYHDWRATPYISFTTSEDIIQYRVASWKNRGPHTLTAIDPNWRLRNGLPILNFKAEIDHYGIPNPYGFLNDYFDDEYLCLWEVTPAEIVDSWDWSDLTKDKNWYQNTVLPAFKRFTETAAAKITKGLSDKPGMGQPTGDRLDALQSIFADLSITRNPLSYSNSDDINRESDDYDEDDNDEYYGYTYGDRAGDDGWDTDDEVEEAHIADDITRFIEENLL
ncbi:hypothetical protein F4859DRAFT_344322 [Xylaria cf. heliscus]|nr:hypothetical protein F4859DRAFT_344322 [Xylaria cf. heliscus]